jgi:hypothetical protein
MSIVFELTQATCYTLLLDSEDDENSHEIYVQSIHGTRFKPYLSD